MRKIRQSGNESRSQEAFREAFDRLMGRLGAIEQAERFAYRWSIATRAGILKLDVSRHAVPGYRTIFGRFDDLQLGSTVAWVNPYSGKWNHHYTGSDNAAYLEDFERQLVALLPRTDHPTEIPPCTDPQPTAN